MAAPVVTVDYSNRLYAEFSKKDEELNALVSKIQESITNLDLSIPQENKYRLVVDIEYIFVKARFLVESESIKVKQVLASRDTPESLKPFFTKRDVYLSQVSSKLTTIQNDLTTLQKLVYTLNLKP